MYLCCCPAWAETEAPKLTPAVRKAVYDAQQAMEKKEFLNAEKCLMKYARKYPQKPHYLVEFTLGNALALMGKEREALSHYKASADLYPDYAPIWQNMGKIYFDMKKYEKGLAVLTARSYLAPIKKEEIMLLGDLNNAIGVFVKAAQYYEKTLNLENSPTDYEKMAYAYIAAHRHAKDIDILDTAIKKKSTYRLNFILG
ncbi:MAG: hypothetical protein SRB2_04006 [Desulfobacteraceae bacterium Eth-SRB2]|nr:MAG: hypothetical protein SRB2_04006 [Desulfobacteraceae bacterium Eth-SRB2]